MRARLVAVLVAVAALATALFVDQRLTEVSQGLNARLDQHAESMKSDSQVVARMALDLDSVPRRADTDALMTAAWCEMLLGERPQELMQAPKADLYLLLEPDLPWIDDGTRFFADPADRHRFARIVAQVLDDAAVPFVRIAGQGPERLAAARAAIGALND